MNKKELLLQKLFASQCTKEELELLFDLIEKDEVDSAPEVMMRLLKQSGKTPYMDTNTSDEILSRVLNQTIEKVQPTKRFFFNNKPFRRISWIVKVASAFLCLIIAGWFVFQQLKPSEVIVQTGFDERKELRLPDGSLVTLNANSTLEYFLEWSEGETRIVELQGEAYFEVDNKAATNTKFQVLTRDLKVEVLGTVFNVNTRQQSTKVFLEEGKVKLNLEDRKASELILKPGEVVSYSARRKTLLRPQKVENEMETSWKNGYLTFKETPLKEILEKFTATSRFEFEIETNELAERKFNLTLPNNDIDKAMSLLSKTTNTKIEKVDDKYIFTMKAGKENE